MTSNFWYCGDHEHLTIDQGQISNKVTRVDG